MKVYTKRSGCGWCHGQGWYNCDSDYDEGDGDGDVQCISDCACLPDDVVDRIEDLEKELRVANVFCQAFADTVEPVQKSRSRLTQTPDITSGTDATDTKGFTMPVVVYATIERDPSFLNTSFYLKKKINACHVEGQLLYKAYCKEAQKIEHDGDPTARSAALKAVHDYYDTTYKLALEEAYTIHTQGAFKPLPEGKYCLRFPSLEVTGAALQAHFHEQVQALLDAYGELLFHFEMEP